MKKVLLCVLVLISVIWFYVSFEYFSTWVDHRGYFGARQDMATLLLLSWVFLFAYMLGVATRSGIFSLREQDELTPYENVETTWPDSFDFMQAQSDAHNDDLKKIEWIWPKLETLLKNNGMVSFGLMAEASVDELNLIIQSAGHSFAMHNPKTWPKQAQLADQKKWDELESYQKNLYRGIGA